MKKADVRSYALTVLLNAIAIIPATYAGALFVFEPRIKSFVMDIVRHESYALQYELTAENLTTFRNVPDSMRNNFHESEIDRLEEKQKLLRGKLSANYKATLE